jgi:hypothetical protein
VGVRNCHLFLGDDSKVESAIHITDSHNSSIMATSAVTAAAATTTTACTILDGESPTSNSSGSSTALSLPPTTITGPQQMRIHESSHLEITFHLSSCEPRELGSGGGVELPTSSSYGHVPLCRTAVILENSNHILFRMRMIQMLINLLHSREHSAGEVVNDEVMTKNRNILLEVKDFNWLRAGISSPNFEIKEEILLEGNRNIRRIDLSTVQTPPCSEYNPYTSISSTIEAAVVQNITPGSYQNEISTGVSADFADDDDDEL